MLSILPLLPRNPYYQSLSFIEVLILDSMPNDYLFLNQSHFQKFPILQRYGHLIFKKYLERSLSEFKGPIFSSKAGLKWLLLDFSCYTSQTLE